LSRLLMRVPGKSEADAFRIAIAFGLVVAASVLVGWVASPAYGAVLFAAGLAAGLIFELAGPDTNRRLALREAAHSPHRHGPSGGKCHILVVATRRLGGEELREELSGRHRGEIELDVLAPILPTRSHYWASDDDHEREEAHARLEASLAWAAEQGLTARGEVGDPDPLAGIEDELRDFGADEVIVATHRRDRTSWLATRMLDHLSRELDVPVKQIAVDDDRDRSAPPLEAHSAQGSDS
jgi:nucleotide-binding universal stress UspA family protein